MMKNKVNSRPVSRRGASTVCRHLPACVSAFLFPALTATADEVTPYRFDDGTATNSFGIGANGVLVNEFTTQLGFETVYGLEIVFGQGAADPFNLVVYSDFNNDGDFNDGVLEYLQPAVRPALESGTYETVVYNFVSGVSFAPGEVFYVGVEELVSGGDNIGVAFDVVGGLRTWAAFDGNNPVEADSVAPVANFGPGFANDAMIRALVAPVAIPEPATFAALGGLVALGVAGGRRRRRVL